jgi:hypothetical protein
MLQPETGGRHHAGAAHAKGAAASERLIAAGQSAFKGGVPLIQETAL